MHTSFVGKVHRMPKKYDPETRAKAIRLVRDHVGDNASEYDAIRAVARRLGMNPETLRKWIRQDEIDHVAGACTLAFVLVAFRHHGAAAIPSPPAAAA
jgi:hypothetical protein